MLSLVIPVYRNEEGLPRLLEALEALERERLRGELEVVFVVDGSPDRCYEILRERLPSFPVPSRLVLLSRNFGAFSAVRAGLEEGAGPHYAVMAADLQEPPELAALMHEALVRGDADVVIGVRESRDDPLSVRLPARVFWSLYTRYVMKEMPPGGVDVFGCTRAFRDEILKLGESHSSLIAQMFWVGFRRRYIPYVRRQREHGSSAWTLRKRVNYLLDSVFAFTDLPIRLLVWVGALGMLFSGTFGMVVFVGRLLGAIEIPGYAGTILAIVFFGALNLTALGIIGSYAWRAYENTKGRPAYIVLRRDGFPGGGGGAHGG